MEVFFYFQVNSTGFNVRNVESSISNILRRRALQTGFVIGDWSEVPSSLHFIFGNPLRGLALFVGVLSCPVLAVVFLLFVVFLVVIMIIKISIQLFSIYRFMNAHPIQKIKIFCSLQK